MFVSCFSCTRKKLQSMKVKDLSECALQMFVAEHLKNDLPVQMFNDSIKK